MWTVQPLVPSKFVTETVAPLVKFPGSTNLKAACNLRVVMDGAMKTWEKCVMMGMV